MKETTESSLSDPAPSVAYHRLSELDALRGMAALFVLLFHYAMIYDEPYFLLRFGVTGVDLFFIISGFVIMMSLERIKYGYEFIVNRFCRLFPTYWTVVTLTLIVICLTRTEIKAGAEVTIDQYLANMTMFQFYLGYEDLDGPYWTMIIDMLFYGVMLMLFYLKMLDRIVPLLTLLVLFGLLLTERYWSDAFARDFISNFPLMQFLPLFLAGILFYKLFKQQKKRVAYIFLIIGCYLAQVLLFKCGGRSSFHVTHPEYKLIAGIYFVLFFLFIFGKLKFIVNRYTMFLGKISFALYLIHQYISIKTIIPILNDHGMNYYIAAFGVALPVSILLATAVTLGVEIPANRWLKPRLLALASVFTLWLPKALIAKYEEIRAKDHSVMKS